MEEYEYSFKVISIKPYIDYCKKNDYEEKSVTIQNRIVYENKHTNKIIARITTKIEDGVKEVIFDCKNRKEQNKSLKISNESIPMIVTKDNKESIKSMLKVMDFYEVANNDRTRYVCEKNNVIFEIDDYTKPQMQVIAVEGIKEEVDIVYKELKEKMNNIIE